MCTPRRLSTFARRSTRSARTGGFAVEAMEPRLLMSDPSGAPDNTAGTARDLGDVNGQFTVTGSVDTGDDQDWVRVSLPRAGRLTARLHDFAFNVHVTIITPNGGFGDHRTASQDQTASADLPAGQYFVLVQRTFDGAFLNLIPTGYKLALTADYAGSLRSDARDLGEINKVQSAVDFVDVADPTDFYRFTTRFTGRLDAALNILSADADLRLYDLNFNLIGQSAHIGDVNESLSLSNLAPGTYFAKVSHVNGNANYHLNLSLTPPDAAGNTRAAARNTGAFNTATRIYDDFVGDVDGDDYYKVAVAGNGPFKLSASLYRLGANADVEWLDASGNRVAKSARAGTADESLDATVLSAGTYYAHVIRAAAGQNTTYRLALTTASLDPAGNTPATARNLGALLGQFVTSDAIGTFDSQDAYRFTMNAAGTLSAAVSNLTADADLFIYRLTSASGTFEQQTLVASSTQKDLTAESISRLSLSAGTYLARVAMVSPTASTNYRIALTSDFDPTPSAQRPAIAPTSTITGFVGHDDPDDTYKLNLTTAATLDLTLSTVAANARIDLIEDRNHNGLPDDAAPLLTLYATPGQPAHIDRVHLTAGTWFIRVTSLSGDTNYTLAVNAQA